GGLKGRWTDFLINANWSNKKDGFLKVYLNGNLEFSYQGSNLRQPGFKTYIKIGVYRIAINRYLDLIKSNLHMHLRGLTAFEQ
ncbi:MAG: hypothetical protein GY799_29830, partial [Desulfobulbaceae bacterium]|nr:hypothetical protein [Desulfobulbaceae bacterium]